MKPHSRRDVLKELGIGAAVFSVGTGSARPESSSADEQSEASQAKPVPGMLMAIAAHPGDALFTMGLPVARQVSTGGHGIFLNLTTANGETGHSYCEIWSHAGFRDGQSG